LFDEATAQIGGDQAAGGPFHSVPQVLIRDPFAPRKAGKRLHFENSRARPQTINYSL
jgi:hypothetical protein